MRSLILVFLVVYLFLQSWRATIIPLVAVPVSLLGTFAGVLNALAPKAYEVVMNTAYNLFPDSAAAKGMKGRDEAPSNEQIAFASLMRGVHW